MPRRALNTAFLLQIAFKFRCISNLHSRFRFPSIFSSIAAPLSHARPARISSGDPFGARTDGRAGGSFGSHAAEVERERGRTRPNAFPVWRFAACAACAAWCLGVPFGLRASWAFVAIPAMGCSYPYCKKNFHFAVSAPMRSYCLLLLGVARVAAGIKLALRPAPSMRCAS